MRTMLARLIGVLAFATATATPAGAQPVGDPIDWAMTTVCPAAPGAASPPTFDEPGCETVPFSRIDPQDRIIWMEANLPIDEALLASPEPLGLFLSAKASSEVYLNGTLIGRNGVPGADGDAETPGRMDAVLHAPRELLRLGDNTLAVRMSSHRGYLRLAQPLHWITIGPYEPPQYGSLTRYSPSLVNFGALLAGGLYFTVLAFSMPGRRASALLATMAFFAAAQLFLEVSRGLFAYLYPFHDLRLLAILFCAFCFGLSLAAHIIFMFEEKRPLSATSAIGVVTALMVVVMPGYDYKSAVALLTPAIACAALTGVWGFQRKPQAIWHFGALAAFSAAIVISPAAFLDVAFFYVVAAFLLFLFIQQALALAEERRLHRLEAERASQLALVLEQREAEKPEATSATIKVTSAGRIEIVPIASVAYFKGAGDYVEIHLESGREILHAASLNELESALPATFVRVHRSHIVNTRYVRRLEREASGVGRLVLSNGAELPVSRRVLPKVRVAFDWSFPQARPAPRPSD